MNLGSGRRVLWMKGNFGGMNRAVIFGAGSHALVCRDILLANQQYEFVGFASRKPTSDSVSLDAWISSDEDSTMSEKFQIQWAHVGIGDNLARKRIYERISPFGMTPLTLICQTAFVGAEVGVGSGTLISTGARVIRGSTIGNGVVINTGASIDHDCVIDDFVHVAPSATLAGGCRIGSQTLVGMGSVVLPGVSIGRNVVIGANSTVNRDIPDDVVAVGSPARVIRESTDIG